MPPEITDLSNDELDALALINAEADDDIELTDQPDETPEHGANTDEEMAR